MNKKDDVILEFMKATIEKVNTCLSSLYALQKIMIEKGIITQEQLLQALNESKSMPKYDLGKRTLDQMLDETRKNL